MGLAVIGSGFGRTGTKSIKEALEILGLGPCHHMYEVLDNPDQIPFWQAAVAGETVDWEQVFAGYNSQIDWPGAHVWRQTAAAFPDAKILHSQRPEESWWKSFSKTIGKLHGVYTSMELPPHIIAILKNNEKMLNDTFGGDWTDKDKAIAAYRQRAIDVQDAFPADRVLVFDVADGWEPLCDFLKVDVPDAPFPHHNLRADFWDVLGGEPA